MGNCLEVAKQMQAVGGRTGRSQVLRMGPALLVLHSLFPPSRDAGPDKLARKFFILPEPVDHFLLATLSGI